MIQSWEDRFVDADSWSKTAETIASRTAERIYPRAGSRPAVPDRRASSRAEDEKAMQMSDGEFASHIFATTTSRL